MVYFKFANKKKLNEHVETVHEGIKPFKRSVCDAKFANNYNSGMVHIKFANQKKIKKHVDTVHEGIKPFERSICDVKFANNYNP